MPVSLFSRDAAMSAIRLWSGAQRLGLRILCGIKTEFRGMEHLPKGAGLIAMKHQSTYDTIAPFLFIQNPGYILKKELLKTPGVRHLRLTRRHPDRPRRRHEDDEEDAGRRQERHRHAASRSSSSRKARASSPTRPPTSSRASSSCTTTSGPVRPRRPQHRPVLARLGLPAQARPGHLRSPCAHRTRPEACRIHPTPERRARSQPRCDWSPKAVRRKSRAHSAKRNTPMASRRYPVRSSARLYPDRHR
jgi:hypothetical protein